MAFSPIIFEVSATALFMRAPGRPEEQRPLSDADFAKLRDWASRYRFARQGSDESLAQIGREIFDWLNGAQSWLTRAIDEASGGLGFEFRAKPHPDVKACAFLNAPWELLAGKNGFLAADPLNPFIASGNVALSTPPDHLDIAALFMAAAVEGQVDLDYEDEEIALLEATRNLQQGGLDLAVEDSGALETLAGGLKLEWPLEIVHLSCHGDLNEHGGCLIFEDAYGMADKVSAMRLMDDGFGEGLPRLLFLSACHSAEGSPDAKVGIALPLSLALIEAGFPALLGWGGPVRDGEATEFARELYSQLLRGRTIEAATGFKEVPQYLRAYLPPMGGDDEADAASARSALPAKPAVAALHAVGRPYEGYCLVFDCETTTDLAQGLRIGAYEVHGIPKNERLDLAGLGKLTRQHLDFCVERGLFYDEAELSRNEIETVERYAKAHSLKHWRREEFVREMVYAWATRLTKDKDQLLVVGHNLAFDISRLAASWTNAANDFRGGFSFKLCNCPNVNHCGFHPSIRVKKLGPGKHLFKLAAASNHVTGKKYGLNLRFLDTMTFGRAMLNTGRSLEEMGRNFQAEVIKARWEEKHGSAITPDYLKYCLHDVGATWSLYCAERDYYRSFNLRRKPWNIFSSASLGKAHLQELGVKPFLRRHTNITPEIIGPSMASYYGGRSEVRIRLSRREVMLVDFKSQYPTVNALMRLQDLLWRSVSRLCVMLMQRSASWQASNSPICSEKRLGRRCVASSRSHRMAIVFLCGQNMMREATTPISASA